MADPLASSRLPAAPARPLRARSLTPAVRSWLGASRAPRVLHVFDHACNLINEYREILSVVSPRIGDGPFNLVVADDANFSNDLRAESAVLLLARQLDLGDWSIDTTSAHLWVSCPEWTMLHEAKEAIYRRLAAAPIPSRAAGKPALPEALTHDLLAALIAGNVLDARAAAGRLAGLGQGLTPSGDDFLLGAMLAAWIIHPPDQARLLTEAVADQAAPLTTSLSAAWLRSAGRGEAAVRWHKLLDALISDEDYPLRNAVQQLMVVGHTSGADALAGFTGVLHLAPRAEFGSCPS